MDSSEPYLRLFLFRNNNPDKGTETFFYKHTSMISSQSSFRNNNPDKGTETGCMAVSQCNIMSLEIITPIRGRKHIKFLKKTDSTSMFRNNNPDKGTETWLQMNTPEDNSMCLEIITPIRGRKHG